ncbi:MAG TPA: carboxypeptidase regulatory-like domain-containing protein [Gemmatimonadaceae bacterium]
MSRKHGVSFDLGADSYTPNKLGAVGSVGGTVTLEGAIPLATAAVTTDTTLCRTAITSAVQAGTKGALSNAVVWIADAKAGKALPIDKRVVISSDNCAIEPRAQTALIGSTVNFFNDDKAFHRIVFLRAGTDDTLTVMPFFNDGEVVPTEKLAKTSGVVDVRCARHPWMRGSLVVFDHPYFAVTEKDGRFRLDSLPPGDYRLMVWHEGLSKPIERKIKVQAGTAGKVDVALKLGAL